ncbi:MAG: HAD-IB family hydrolase [Spirochaetales bacterium]|nr:HAD-IB family hydrolase [Spirochaetales bacterium]
MRKNVSAAFFDIDHTLTKHSTAMRCIAVSLPRMRVPLRFCFSIIGPYFKYKKGTLDLDKCDRMLKGMDGIKEDSLNKMGNLSFQKYHEKDLYEEMVNLINDYKKAGIPVVLATSSPRFVVEPYFRHLGADHLIATELAVDGSGLTLGKFDGPVAFDEGKKRLVEEYMKRKGYDPKNCAFYSDSIHDLPTLKMAGEPVAVNPDEELVKEARKNNWDILDYRR